MAPERPIALELRFTEPLICRRLVRKGRIGLSVSRDIDRNAGRKARLQVDDLAFRRVRIFRGIRIYDFPKYRELRPVVPVLVPRPQSRGVQEDRGAEIDFDFPYRVAEVFELTVRIASRVA
jgi:hypothetical protein